MLEVDCLNLEHYAVPYPIHKYVVLEVYQIQPALTSIKIALKVMVLANSPSPCKSEAQNYMFDGQRKRDCVQVGIVFDVHD